MRYKVYAALHEETDKGWVWLKVANGVPRTTIKLTNAEKSRTAYCEYRELDERFVKRYNKDAEHCKLPKTPEDWEQVIVISDWYRRALGGLELQTKVDLQTYKPLCFFWADMRAACHHPEPGVRVATRLAVFGTWLGLSAFLFAVQADYQWPSCYPWVATLILFGVALAASWGVRHQV